MNPLQPYAVKRHRIEGETNYIKLIFEPFIIYSEKHLHNSIRDRRKHPYPPRLSSFIKYMFKQCENPSSGMIHSIQVYSRQDPVQLENQYLTSRYFTTGLKYVEKGKKHYIINLTNNMPLYVYKCQKHIHKYRKYANCSTVLVNEAWIRCDFEQLTVKEKDCLELEETSLYFFYTVSHSIFSTGQISANSSREFNAANICEVQIIEDEDNKNVGQVFSQGAGESSSSTADRRNSTNGNDNDISTSDDVQELKKRIDSLLDEREGLLDNAERLRERNEQLESMVDQLKAQLQSKETKINSVISSVESLLNNF